MGLRGCHGVYVVAVMGLRGCHGVYVAIMGSTSRSFGKIVLHSSYETDICEGVTVALEWSKITSGKICTGPDSEMQGEVYYCHD